MRIRDATAADYPAYARLFPELGPEFPVPSQRDWLDTFAAETLVAERGGAIVGYVLGAPFGTMGHVSQLVVTPSCRREGLGRQLMFAMAERFRAMGCDAWQLNVKRENTAAYATYRALGFSRKSTCSWVSLAPSSIEMLPRGAYEVHPLDPAHDAEVESQFALRFGEIAWARTFAGRLVHEVLRGSDRWGMGIYTPETRFVVPLRLRDPAALFPLLASLPGAATEGVRIGVESDETLLATALRCGGTIDLETDRLVAALPDATASR